MNSGQILIHTSFSFRQPPAGSIYMHLKLTLPFLLTASLIQAQIIQVTYQEELTFAYLESEDLNDQIKNDELIKAEWTYGYEIGKGSVRYSFDLDNQTVTRTERKDDTLGWKHIGTWNILYFLSPWDPKTQSLSCVASTQWGEYFYSINSFRGGSRCLLKSHKNPYRKPIKKLPDLDWGLYNVGEISTEYGDFTIEVLPP